MSQHPCIPLDFGDVLKQTLFWSGEQRALYVLLLSVQWYSGPLPKDLSALAGAIGFDEQAFRRLWAGKVHEQFVETDSGFVHAKLEERRQHLQRRSATLRDAGRRGGQTAQAHAWSARRTPPDAERAEAGALATDGTSREPGRKPGSKAGSNPGFKPGFNPGFKPGFKPGSKSGSKPSSKPGSNIPPDQAKVEERPQRSEEKPQTSESTLVVDSSSQAFQPLGAEPSPSAPASAKSPPKRKRIPPEHPTEPFREWARENTPDIDFDIEIATLRDHEFRDAHSDWNAVIRNWLRRAQKGAAKSRRPFGARYVTRFEAHKRRLYGDA